MYEFNLQNVLKSVLVAIPIYAESRLRVASSEYQGYLVSHDRFRNAALPSNSNSTLLLARLPNNSAVWFTQIYMKPESGDPFEFRINGQEITNDNLTVNSPDGFIAVQLHTKYWSDEDSGFLLYYEGGFSEISR